MNGKFIINRNDGYTVISNYHIKDKRLSLKAKGLMSLMLSLPDTWNYSKSGLCSLCKEGSGAVDTALDELKEYGYLEIRKYYPSETESGRYEYEYIVHEKPLGDLEEKPKEKPKEKPQKKAKKEDDPLKGITGELLEVYEDFFEMRRLIKSPMTNRAKKQLRNKVEKLEPTSQERQKKMLEEAIEKCWKSVYPLKDKGEKETSFNLNEYEASMTAPPKYERAKNG